MKPVPIPPPEKKLPLVTHLTMVRDPEAEAWVVVMMQTKGDIIVRRKVISQNILSKSEALDELCRLATRIYWFDEAAEFAEAG